jgi:hypothetical protein
MPAPVAGSSALQKARPQGSTAALRGARASSASSVAGAGGVASSTGVSAAASPPSGATTAFVGGRKDSPHAASATVSATTMAPRRRAPSDRSQTPFTKKM